ncbi:STAS domain-containing protein [Polyangium jinanense]|uniref:STAS domain-containing protein n=1 Tax=Polyangium jinanense TaxID=2829994 RepID=A0A9X3X2Z9_9BACT|nr:STAS domain-containing protein [Polyangium jinanense]MDC3957366.1 STAS domain-containing protein [Polyangium jinanense]MDC3982769.1 STAS domain-containing protein [Polyangium jinanense]
MSHEAGDVHQKPPLAARLVDEEMDLLRWIGSRMSRVLRGQYDELPFIDRTDELGIVANMVARVARELRRSRERDEARREELVLRGRELEARVKELEEARAEQERLLAAVQELSAPVLEVYRGVLLVPIAGALDATMLAQAEERVLARVAAAGARTVILDITGALAIDPVVAEGLVRIARALSLLGARVVLCGVSAAAARTAVQQGLDFAPAIVRADLGSALEAAIGAELRRTRRT